MKGIILAGGAGSRLYPLTEIITKQLQPVYDKPMIYYPLSQLMMMGIRDILLITTEHDQPHFKKVLGNGDRLGINISYEIQKEPKGIAQAYLIAEKFIDGESSVLILGDNLFHGNFDVFRKAIKNQTKNEKNFLAQVFAYPVNDPERYGVVEFDKKTNMVKSIEEKPESPKSNLAIPGLYIFDEDVIERVKSQKPSARGELEITDLVKTYMEEGKLRVEKINRGMAWMDTGTPHSLLEASSYISAIEQRQGLKVACLEEVSYRYDYIDDKKFLDLIEDIPNSEYRNYLQNIYKEKNE